MLTLPLSSLSTVAMGSILFSIFHSAVDLKRLSGLMAANAKRANKAVERRTFPTFHIVTGNGSTYSNKVLWKLLQLYCRVEYTVTVSSSEHSTL